MSVKENIRNLILTELRSHVAVVERAVQDAAAATMHADAKSEGKYDTRAIESSYLAGAQSERLLEMRKKIQIMEGFSFPAVALDAVVKIGTLVQTESAGGTLQNFIILPGISGFVAKLESFVVTVLSPESPMGKAILGKRPGDDIDSPKGEDLEITKIS